MEMPSKITTPIIHVANVSKVFGRQKELALKLRGEGKSKYEVEQATKTNVAIHNANFEVKKGETFALIGLSGSGKSTLLRCLNGLVQPSEGKILLENDDIAQLSKKNLQQIRRNKIGMVFQNVGLLPNRTVLDNITFGLELKGVSAQEREKRGKDALEYVGLNGQAYKRIFQLSGGMQQRVGLARALASDQEILLMDEPFSALDPLIRREMQKLFLDIQDEIQKTVIFVTHDLDEALTLGHRAAVMKDGEIVQLGTAEDILSTPATEYVEQLVQGVDYSKIRLAKSAMKPVQVFAYEKELPQVILRRMKINQLSSIYVVNENHCLKGVLSLYQVLEQVEKRKQDLSQAVSDHFYKVHINQTLREILPLFAKEILPVAVVDDHNRLKGEILSSSLIASLTEKVTTTEKKDIELKEVVQK
ncbi:quaternary amine ABC transporter ATP-binding protein [Niallia sp. 01092]|uniref:quaternary amine ABC transporter ATP-binding protein n=1 Tax=unclassified Niallia TaxID=2837522 RepID=UPI003FD147AE